MTEDLRVTEREHDWQGDVLSTLGRIEEHLSKLMGIPEAILRLQEADPHQFFVTILVTLRSGCAWWS